METQICTDCGEEKVTDEFRLRHSRKGRNTYCVDCGIRRANTNFIAPWKKRTGRNRPTRNLADIPDGYSASIVVSPERRKEILRRIER